MLNIFFLESLLTIETQNEENENQEIDDEHGNVV